MKFHLAKIKTSFFLHFLLFFSLSIISRLPHYLSKNMYFDIDEALIGIMAQDFLETGKLPYYFYLQNYGFSSAEVLSCSVFILTLGKTVWSLKLGGLLLFSLGITFLFKLISNSMDKKLSYLFAIILICFPSWYLWGGMLRGGYVTSFLITAIIFYVIQTFKANKKSTVLLITLLFYFGFDSHSLIIIGITPIILLWLWNTNTRIFNILAFFSFLAILFWLNAHYLKVEYYGDANNFEQASNFFTNFKTNILGFHSSFTNFFGYSEIFELPAYWYYLSWILLISIFITIIYAFVLGDFQDKIKIAVLVIGALLSMFTIGLSQNFAPRYLLGFWNTILLTFIYAVILLNNQSKRKSTFILSFTFIACFVGTSSGYSMQRHWFKSKESQQVDYSLLHKELSKKGVKALVGYDNILIWNYLYGESIPAVNICDEERTEKYKIKVVEVYKNNPSKIAIFGYYGIFNGLENNNAFNSSKQFNILGDYFYYVSPTKKDLNNLKVGIRCFHQSHLFE